jgi:hypothetical protein
MPAKKKGRRIGGFLLGVLVAVLALAAGAWIGGLRPPTNWRLPRIEVLGEPEPGEVISDTERRSLERVLRERDPGKGN